MDKPPCRNCGEPMAMRESIAVGVCMACRPWFVGVDPAVADGDRTAVKCWCGHVTTWGRDEKQPRSCPQCAARLEFKHQEAEMSVVRLGSAASAPRDVVATLAQDADRMRVVVCVVLTEDGTWHVRHSTAQQSIVDSAAVNLMKFVTR